MSIELSASRQIGPITVKAQSAGITAAILTSLAWGGQFPIMSALLKVFDPFWLTTVRYVGASAVLLLMLYFIEGKRAFQFSGRGRALAFLGAVSIAGFNLFVLEGIRFAGPAHGGLIVAMSPLFSALLIWLHTGTKPKTVTLTMIAVAIAGVGLVVTKGQIASVLHGESAIGDLFVAIGVLSISIYAVGSAEFSDWTPLRFTALSVTLGTVTTVAATVVATASGISHLPAQGFGAAFGSGMLYMILVAAVFAYVSWNFAVARIGPQRAVLFMNLIPIVTFTIELFLGQHFTAVEYTGAAITIAALVVNNIATRSNATQPAHTQALATKEAA